MTRTSVKTSELIFKRTPYNDFGQVSLDGPMLTFILEVDGKRSVAEISQITGIFGVELKTTIKKLISSKLIEPVRRPESHVDEEFIGFLKSQLSMAIGPIAAILIDDAANDMGHNVTRFPVQLAAELVEFLSHEIHQEDEQIRFKQNMVQKIRQKGYVG
jgi:hypothetical protein